MNELTGLLLKHGVGFVFLNVLFQQLGVPVPAVPTLLVAGALAADGSCRSESSSPPPLVATVAADTVWYLLGRRYGQKVLKTLCKVSLSPDSCVRQTEGLFDTYGLASLLFAKFVPGYSTVAPPLAGAAGAPLPRFLLFTAGGTLLWTGSALPARRPLPRRDRTGAFLPHGSRRRRARSPRGRAPPLHRRQVDPAAAFLQGSCAWRASARPTCAGSWTKARPP